MSPSKRLADETELKIVVRRPYGNYIDCSGCGAVFWFQNDAKPESGPPFCPMCGRRTKE